jgi:hypothetical protein
MNESVLEMAVADLLEDLRRLSTLERDFLERWRAALDTMSSTPQLARVFDRVKLLAAVEAKAQRDRDITIVAAIERLEFGGPPRDADCPSSDDAVWRRPARDEG